MITVSDYNVFHKDAEGTVTSVTLRDATPSQVQALVNKLKEELPGHAYWSGQATK